MENDTKKFIIAIFAVGIFIGSIIGGIYVYSGVSPPFTVINSGSMQHSDESSIGTIDTGDMVIVKNPDYQEITTYVEGSNATVAASEIISLSLYSFREPVLSS